METLAAYKEEWMKHLNYNMSLVCFKNGSNDIIGVNILYIETNDAPKYTDPIEMVEVPNEVRYPK